MPGAGQKPEEDVRYPGVGGTDNCEYPVNSGNRTWVLYKSN